MADFKYGPTDDPVSNFFYDTPLGRMIPPIRRAICELYRDFPGFTLGTVMRIPRANILTPFIPALCEPADRPPPPLPGNNPGGQCCTRYNVRVVGTVNGNPVSLQYNGLPGRVRLVYREGVGDPRLHSGGFVLIYGEGCPGVTRVEVSTHGGQNMAVAPTGSLTVAPVTPAQDNCADNQLPEYPRTIPPRDRLNFPIVVPIGGVNVSVPVSINIGSPQINFNFKPEINVQVGGFNLIFGVDGISISVGSPTINNEFILPDPRPPVDRPPPFQPTPAPPYPPGTGYPGRPPGGSPSPSPSPSPCPDVNLQPVLDAIANLKLEVDEVEEDVKLLLDCDRCDRPPAGLCSKRLIGTGNSAVFQLGERAAWVGVEVTQRPTNWKGYLVDNSPDVLICGWHEFGSAIAQGVRTPIQYEKNIYPVLEGAEKFSFGLQSGHIANYYVYDKPDEEN